MARARDALTTVDKYSTKPERDDAESSSNGGEFATDPYNQRPAAVTQSLDKTKGFHVVETYRVEERHGTLTSMQTSDVARSHRVAQR